MNSNKLIFSNFEQDTQVVSSEYFSKRNIIKEKPIKIIPDLPDIEQIILRKSLIFPNSEEKENTNLKKQKNFKEILKEKEIKLLKGENKKMKEDWESVKNYYKNYIKDLENDNKRLKILEMNLDEIKSEKFLLESKIKKMILEIEISKKNKNNDESLKYLQNNIIKLNKEKLELIKLINIKQTNNNNIIKKEERIYRAPIIEKQNIIVNRIEKKNIMNQILDDSFKEKKNMKMNEKKFLHEIKEKNIVHEKIFINNEKRNIEQKTHYRKKFDDRKIIKKVVKKNFINKFEKINNVHNCNIQSKNLIKIQNKNIIKVQNKNIIRAEKNYSKIENKSFKQSMSIYDLKKEILNENNKLNKKISYFEQKNQINNNCYCNCHCSCKQTIIEKRNNFETKNIYIKKKTEIIKSELIKKPEIIFSKNFKNINKEIKIKKAYDQNFEISNQNLKNQKFQKKNYLEKVRVIKYENNIDKLSKKIKKIYDLEKKSKKLIEDSELIYEKPLKVTYSGLLFSELNQN